MKTVIIEFSIRFEGERTPELAGMVRRKLSDEQTLEEFADQVIREECRKLHAPRVEWRTV